MDFKRKACVAIGIISSTEIKPLSEFQLLLYKKIKINPILLLEALAKSARTLPWRFQLTERSRWGLVRTSVSFPSGVGE